ncbi:hypothetical protein THIOKS1260011 [Thiocapsa sp. KS1]|nr:hypothetical protein THIOKS1260011 [Thiocapsa sp. KS1]
MTVAGPRALMESARIPVLIIRSVSANADSWLEQVFGNAGQAFHAITVRFTLRNLW